jgi:hypothetical protein
MVIGLEYGIVTELRNLDLTIQVYTYNWDWITEFGLDYRSGAELWNFEYITDLGLNYVTGTKLWKWAELQKWDWIIEPGVKYETSTEL